MGAVQLWQSWARMEVRLGRPRKALTLYRRATSLFSEDEQLLVGWAKLEAEHGDQETARKTFACALQMCAAHAAARPRCAALLAFALRTTTPKPHTR